MRGFALCKLGSSGFLPFSIRRFLFNADEQGFWYDPSNVSTLFQDSAGTTPVTEVGDPVGRVLDLSGRGNHAVQTVSANRPLWGRWPESAVIAGGVRNLLTYTNEQENAAWSKRNLSVTVSAVLSPDGSSFFRKFIPNTSAVGHAAGPFLSIVSGLSYTYTVYASAAEYTQVSISRGSIGGFNPTGTYVFDLATGTIIGTPSSGIATIEAIGGGVYRCRYTATAIATLSGGDYLTVYAASGGGLAFAGDGTSGVLIWGAQFEQSATPTAYQRVGASSAYDVTEAGQPTKYFLYFNGVNYAMRTAAAVNFSISDEMSVFAGVTKLCAIGTSNILVELSENRTNNAGSFTMIAPSSASEYFYSSRGAATNDADQVASTASGVFAAPVSNVTTGLSDISADSNILRIDGALIDTATGNQGSGKYGNYVAYIGARAGTSIYFNGNLYQLITRGELTDGALLDRTEQYVASKTKGSLT